MDERETFTTNGTDREQMLPSWLASVIDFVCEGQCIFLWVWL